MEQTDLQGLLGTLTQNPELMGKLRQIAGGLVSSGALGNAPKDSPPETAESEPSTEPTNEVLAPAAGHRYLGDFCARKQLLSALRPYLHEKRRKRLDDILNLICLLEAAEKSGLLGQFFGSAKSERREEESHVSS